MNILEKDALEYLKQQGYKTDSVKLIHITMQDLRDNALLQFYSDDEDSNVTTWGAIPELSFPLSLDEIKTLLDCKVDKIPVALFDVGDKLCTIEVEIGEDDKISIV